MPRPTIARSLTKTADLLLDLPRPAKRLVAVLFDVSLCVLTTWLAFWLRLDEWLPLYGHVQWRPELAALVSVLLAVPLFIRAGFYRAIFRYAGWQAALTLARTLALYGAIYAAVFSLLRVPGVPRSIGILQPLLLFFAIGGSRLLARFWLGGLYRAIVARSALPKALIYGAGRAGQRLAGALAGSPEIRVVGFLDDDEKLHGHTINGLPVFAPGRLATLVAEEGVQDVLLAIPSASRQRRFEILEQLRCQHVTVRMLPSVVDLAQGKVMVTDLREPDVEDLLGRVPISPDKTLLEKNVRGKTVLVTGAGGSIGSELCRQIIKLGPQRLLLVEHSEYALYAIHQELLRSGCAEDELVPLLASVRDEARMRAIMQQFRPQTLYHAAAYKHVPLVEHNPAEGVYNNAFGTLTVAQAALEAQVGHFVLISTDKAVRPTNVMGASKRLAEMVLQALAAQGEPTCFTMVRFGNVLDSSGSVVPLFRRQIRMGGPVTLTHPEVTRYFMTIPEAAQLVIQASAMGEGGEVFLLDMGEPVRIMELARRMIELSGLTVKDDANPAGDIEIQIIGLRSGEKLYEELLIGDNPEPTHHPRIKKARESFLPWAVLWPRLVALRGVLDAGDAWAIRQQLAALVSGYAPSELIPATDETMS